MKGWRPGMKAEGGDEVWKDVLEEISAVGLPRDTQHHKAEINTADLAQKMCNPHDAAAAGSSTQGLRGVVGAPGCPKDGIAAFLSSYTLWDTARLHKPVPIKYTAVSQGSDTQALRKSEIL